MDKQIMISAAKGRYTGYMNIAVCDNHKSNKCLAPQPHEVQFVQYNSKKQLCSYCWKHEYGDYLSTGI